MTRALLAAAVFALALSAGHRDVAAQSHTDDCWTDMFGSCTNLARAYVACATEIAIQSPEGSRHWPDDQAGFMCKEVEEKADARWEAEADAKRKAEADERAKAHAKFIPIIRLGLDNPDGASK